VKNFVRGLVAALLLLLAVGCSDDSGDETPTDPTAAVKVELGKAFTWNDFSVADGWKIESSKETINMEEVDRPFLSGKVTNEADEARFAVFEFVFVADGKLQSTIRCTSLEIPTGETTDLGCPGFQNPPSGYDLIQVQEITR
jgi:hypothetical protein